MELTSNLLRRIGLPISAPECLQVASCLLLRQALESWDMLEQQKSGIRELRAGQAGAGFIEYNANQGAELIVRRWLHAWF